MVSDRVGVGKESYLYEEFGQDPVSVWATQDEFSSSYSFFFFWEGGTKVWGRSGRNGK